jgi:spore maturation protein CgeB
MSYRFLRFSHIYPEYEKMFLKANPDYQDLSFHDLNDRFTHTHYGYSGYFMNNIENLGNNGFDFTPSFKTLQTAWAREHNVKYDEKNWMKDIIFKQVECIQPDIIFLLDLFTFNRSIRNQLRKICDNQVKIVTFHSTDIVNFHEVNDIDLFCTAIAGYVEKLKKAGGNPFLLSHAFEHKLLNHIDTNQMRDLDFTFAGSLGNGFDNFSSRYYIIGKLLLRTPLQVWGQVNRTIPQSYIKTLKVCLSGKSSQVWGQANRTIPQSYLKILKVFYKVDRLLNKAGISNDFLNRLPIFHFTAYSRIDPSSPPLDLTYKDRFHESVFGLDYYSLLARSKITLNIQGEYQSGNESVNMRLYEATGMKSCLITDWKSNIQNLFEPDKEIVTFKTINECVEKVRYFLENKHEREAIAQAGQVRTLKDHTWEKRIQMLNFKIEELIG